ncbi:MULTISPECIES: DUF3073 domain-containing protein [Crossiella]|uniref:DUF3073 domain-containing protein n=1 Tax=Crossiella cryophila TaxID=43355 RepID=A0A7W7C7I8_9PSEU|nr:MULTISPECIES: DUF3073 domain-containing protein [Crossiella]MBB4674659.1 hypothetical protein [Crossiella cryophila]MCK2236550.1 DUF3073 domain-containing protein [Crossiella sp. S99.2]MCK2250217.1 DUF3073 domain-containing protein [Crossiella sp. S99.1]
MGRGRAKAKQAKVARELKYSTRSTDFDALQRELSGGELSSGDQSDGDRSDEDRVDDSYDDGQDDRR